MAGDVGSSGICGGTSVCKVSRVFGGFKIVALNDSGTLWGTFGAVGSGLPF